MRYGIIEDVPVGKVCIITAGYQVNEHSGGFADSRVYSQPGLGVLIKNENLVINSFQVSILFYPIIPGIGRNVFKLNSVTTTYFGFRDFEIEKPGRVKYQ